MPLTLLKSLYFCFVFLVFVVFYTSKDFRGAQIETLAFWWAFLFGSRSGENIKLGFGRLIFVMRWYRLSGH